MSGPASGCDVSGAVPWYQVKNCASELAATLSTAVCPAPGETVSFGPLNAGGMQMSMTAARLSVKHWPLSARTQKVVGSVSGRVVTDCPVPASVDAYPGVPSYHVKVTPSV